MKHIAESLTLGLAVLFATSIAPKAADWAVGSDGAVRDFGSVKDYRNAAVAVPVPAPTPSNTPMADWYIRADFGYNFATNGSISATGGISPSGSGSLSDFAFGGIGAGRYLTPSVRAEMSIDFQAKKPVTQGTYTFGKTIAQPGAPLGSVDTLNYNVTQSDNSGTADQTLLLSLYYDFHNGSRFTPYVGAGLGVDFRSLKRGYSQNAVCASATNSVSGAYPAGTCPAPVGYATKYNHTSYDTSIGFAAALMLGAAYQVSEGVYLDSGYRMLWDGASVTAAADGIGGATNVSVGDRLNHEFRTGVRIDLN